MKNASILLVGATGTVGREALRAVKAEGAHVRALARSAASAAALGDQVEVVRGDLRDEDAVRRALDGASAALYVSPHEPDEEALAASFVRACEAAGTRLVFVGVHIDGGNAVSRAVKRFVFGRMLPHYRPKFRISEGARQSKASPIVLMPTNFYQNDELFRDQLLAGTFLPPFAKPINRVDARDIGDAAARALLDPSLPSGAYPVVGPASVTGDDCAEVWAEALGRAVTCERDVQRALEALGHELDGKKRADFVATYGLLTKLAIPTSADDVARTTALLGREPTPYGAYVRRTAAAWSRPRESAAAKRSAVATA